MKTIIRLTSAIFLISALTLSACGDRKSGQKRTHEHSHLHGYDSNAMTTEKDSLAGHIMHKSLQDNFAHREIIILDNPYTAGRNVITGMKEVVSAYLALKDAFANDDAAATNVIASMMARKVRFVEAASLTGDGKDAWEQHSALYISKLAELQHIQSLDDKRSYFGHISEIVYCTIKSFNLKEEMDLYAAYCPMAFGGQGAYWITESRELRNPYFGEKMSDCGRIEEVL